MKTAGQLKEGKEPKRFATPLIGQDDQLIVLVNVYSSIQSKLLLIQYRHSGKTDENIIHLIAMSGM